MIICDFIKIQHLQSQSPINRVLDWGNILEDSWYHKKYTVPRISSMRGVLKRNIFTLLARDIIDLFATSTMARSHYHATSVTCPMSNRGEKRKGITELTYRDNVSISRTLEGLPKIIARLGLYLSVRPINLKGQKMKEEAYIQSCYYQQIWDPILVKSWLHF